MRNYFFAILTIWSFYAPVTYGNVYSIDSNQSYISVPYLKWERGLPWEFLGTDGETMTKGYSWSQVIDHERFSIGGELVIEEVAGTKYNGRATLRLNSENVSTSAPTQLGFAMPGYLEINLETNAVKTCVPWCNQPSSPWNSGTSWWYGGDIYADSASGSITDVALSLDGQHKSLSFAGYSFLGNLDPPAAPVIDYSQSSYSYRIVATVPEPSHALMLLAGLVLLVPLRKIKT